MVDGFPRPISRSKIIVFIFLVLLLSLYCWLFCLYGYWITSLPSIEYLFIRNMSTCFHGNRLRHTYIYKHNL